MSTRTRRCAAVLALALPLAMAGCDNDDAGQFDTSPAPGTGDESAGGEASREGDEEPATAPQVGAED